MTLTISSVASEIGMSADALRYYERAGLLPPVPRNSAGYRAYEESILDRLRFIKGAQRLGLRLREVRDLLRVLDQGHCPCGHTEELLRTRVREIDAEIGRLSELKAELARIAERLPPEACATPDGGRWRCEIEFIRAGGGEN